jgi:hypothetical protein
MTETEEIIEHVLIKIDYHEKLRLMHEAAEEFEKCTFHRDEIVRLNNMLR